MTERWTQEQVDALGADKGFLPEAYWPLKPIYDQPNHRHYGPTRRLHLILMQLFGDDLAAMEEQFVAAHDMDWTAALANRLDDGDDRAAVSRAILRSFLVGD